ncbi:alcohol oxidase [Lentinula edodes]|uniref:alcohol oxidase n=1 Tax=Lentinula edodes TaxID=5353 RepID=UPI001E8EEF70|nr:alcohol oxidase [Lentinula edodes]KAH7876487.1 alcohol oxidase [Lentinula edodes]
MWKSVDLVLDYILFFTLLGLVRSTVITDDTSDLGTAPFEYIIVGGGTTALAVANRLAVNHSVLVVERGPDLVNDEVINDPFTKFGTPSPCHFQIDLAPQMGFNGSRMIPMTYCLGGSSSINTMIGSRPTFAGMSAIEALGNPGWGWNDFLPLLHAKIRNFSPPNPTQRAEGADFIAVVHGFDGPVGVSFAQPLIAPTLQNAAKNTTNTVFEGEVALSPDMGDGFSGGEYCWGPMNASRGLRYTTLQMDRRSSSAWSYLYPQAQQREGLTVLTGHRVNNLLTSTGAGGNVTATGILIEPTAGGTTSTFNVSREVVLSAGTIYSPAILQRSGIGNTTFLQSIGIEPVLDLPGVGANFQDQILLTNVSFSLTPSANITNVTGGGEVLLAVVVAHPTATDTLGSNGTSAVDKMLRNISAEHALSTNGIVTSETLTTQAALIAEAYQIDRTSSPLHVFSKTSLIFYTPGPTSINVWAQSVLPLSRGTIRINTTDPSVDPIADAQYLTTEVDMIIAVAAARKVSSIAVTPPFSDLLIENALAEAGVPQVGAADEEVGQWVLSTYTPGTHPIGSNSMMPKELGGVVSPELLVYGTINLRIADASIIPLSVFPHTTLGLYGVAEKAAEMILQTVAAES